MAAEEYICILTLHAIPVPTPHLSLVIHSVPLALSLSLSLSLQSCPTAGRRLTTPSTAPTMSSECLLVYISRSVCCHVVLFVVCCFVFGSAHKTQRGLKKQMDAHQSLSTSIQCDLQTMKSDLGHEGLWGVGEAY